MEIRPIDPSDPAVARALLALQRAAYRIEAELVGSDAIPPLHETLEQLIATRETFLAAFEDDVLLGAVSYLADARIVDVHRLVVLPGSFRRGIGTALVRAVLDAHPAHDAIVSTGAANAPARALYARLGFVAVGEHEPVPGLRVVRLRRRAP